MVDVLDTLFDNIWVFLALPVAVIAVFFVHELGHYWAARLVGMKVNTVSVGFGRKLWENTDDTGTRWILRLYPVKAHVHIADYQPDIGETLWRRICVVLAGPLANFALPFVLFSLFFLIWGKPAVPTIITGVELGMPIQEAGLRPGDKILSINGVDVFSMEDCRKFTEEKTEAPLTFVYQRNGKNYTVEVLPQWYEYKDTDGKPRAHGRTGFMARQLPNSFDMLKSVNGFEIDQDDDDIYKDIARDLIIKNLGKSVELGLDSRDREVHIYEVDLNAERNQHLFDSEHKDYDSFYTGTIGDNFYLKLTLGEALLEGTARSTELVYNILRLPFDMFPIDREWIVPGPEVSKRTSPVGNTVYQLFFTTSLFSVLIGWLNLVPFPGLDGSVLLLNTAEALSKRPLSNRRKALLIVGALLLLYLSVFIANATNIREYFEFKTEEFFEKDS